MAKSPAGRKPGVGGRTAAGTRERILEASLDLFAEKGFEGAGITEIAKRVGITKSVIYYHFRSKTAILDQIARETIGATVELKQLLAREFAEKLRPGADLEPMATALLDFALSHRKSIRLLLMESIKSTRMVPLLEFWDANLRVGAEVSRQMGIDLSTRSAQDVLFEAFFMMVLPVVGFTVLEQKWAAHYGQEPADMRKLFARVMAINLQELWLGRLLPGAKRSSR